MAVQAIKDGAFDSLERPCSDQALLDKVRNALIIAEGAVRQRKEQPSAQERPDRLTPREKEVCDKLLDGKVTNEITLELNPECTAGIVENHRAKVFAKIALRNALEFAQLVNSS